MDIHFAAPMTGFFRVTSPDDCVKAVLDKTSGVCLEGCFRLLQYATLQSTSHLQKIKYNNYKKMKIEKQIATAHV